MSIFSRMRTIFISWAYIVAQQAPVCFGNSVFYLQKGKKIDHEWVRSTKNEIVKELSSTIKTENFELVILNIQELK